jgi:four helix bundle protein
MGNYNNLEVWKLSKELAINIYHLSNQKTFQKDFSLRDQIRRSAVSVPSNLAEGDESGSQKMSINFFFIAKASLAELRTQFEIAKEIGYVEDSIFTELSLKMEMLSKRITKLIQHRQSLIN